MTPSSGERPRTVTLSAAQTVNSLSFKTDGYVLTAQTLTMGGPSISVDPGVTATINSVVAGSAGLVKNGGGTLKLGDGQHVYRRDDHQCGRAEHRQFVAGRQSIVAGVERIDQQWLDAAVQHQRADADGQPADHAGRGGGVIDVQGFSDAIAGVIGGSSLTKIGGGTLTLTNVNTYTGATNVSAGTLAVGASMTGGASVNVSSGAKMSIVAGSGAVIRTGTVSTAGTGKIDLADNKLIVTGMSVGSWNGSNYDGVTGLIKSGRGDGTWNGGGIVTSQTAATASALTTLAVAAAGDVGKTSFGGVSVAPSDVLVMYTYAGDANLEGTIDARRLFSDRFALQRYRYARAMLNGDFNYDGQVDADDYFIIDQNYARQGAAFSSGAVVSGAAAVPEPSMLGTVLILAGAGSRCRKRWRLSR